MNTKHKYYVYEYDTRGPHVSGCITPLYQNSVVNMDINLHNKLPKKIHTIISKKSGNPYLSKMLFIL
jgi:hypothetical protein